MIMGVCTIVLLVRGWVTTLYGLVCYIMHVYIFSVQAFFSQVDTVKRLCIKKLPRVLVIQLKRFDYDWERSDCPTQSVNKKSFHLYLPTFLIESIYTYDVICLYLPCREMAVKFNDYFEFPREFDMAPYTAATLAELEGAGTRNNQM